MIHVSLLLLLFLQPFGSFRVPEMGRDSSETGQNRTLWQDLDEIPLVDCEDRWSCRGYNYTRLAKSERGHYYDKNCACDHLCILMQDCCPDVQLLPLLSVRSEDDAGYVITSAGKAGNDSIGNVSPDRQRVSTDKMRTGSAFSSKETSFQSKSGDFEDRMTSKPALNEKLKDLIGQYNNIYAKYDLSKDVFSCVYDAAITNANRVSLVTKCPQHHDDPIINQMCHNVTDDDMMTRLPVSGRVTKVLYRNMFCAMCHQEPFVYWAAGILCSSRHRPLPYDSNTTLSELPLNSTHCEVFYKPPSDLYQWRPCRDTITHCCKDCPHEDTPVYRQIAARCEETDGYTQRMVYSYTQAFRNQYCALCNHNNLSVCEPLSWEAVVTMGTRRRDPYSFSILLDINSNSGSTTVGHRYRYQTVERKESASCDDGHVFDPFRAVCRPVSCGPGRYYSNKTCRPVKDWHDTGTTDSAVESANQSKINGTAADHFAAENCSYIQLNSTEYELYGNGTLLLLDANATYNSSDYVVIGDDVFLCLNYTQNYTRTITTQEQSVTFTFSLVEAIVSTCGICISLLALAVTICVYVSLRPLRNIPGQNLLSLVSALFVADLLLLVAPSAGATFTACAVIAGVMHYFFLASFLWMNVMALDVWFTFSKAFVKAGDRGKSSKRFIMYSAYAWLTPLLFVLSAVLVQALHPDSAVSPRYGMGICWLANKNALLLFFAAPLFLLLLFNTAFFVISARNISRAKRTTARMLGKEDEGKMAIYVKLTVVMGITWLLGFLAALVPGNQVLVYCFIVMNTLQGLFICISFVFTDKVLSLLKDKFCRRRQFRVTRSGSTDMTNVSKSLSGNRKNSNASARSHNVIL